MLEDKHAQRILAPQCAPAVGMCCLLPFPFLSPVTQIPFNFSSQRWGQPKARQMRDLGPVLHCLLLPCPWDLAEDKSQTLLELAVLECVTQGPQLWDCHRHWRLRQGSIPLFWGCLALHKGLE